MKRISIKFVLLVCFGLLNAGCQKGFLDLAPNENITEEQAFNSIVQAENYVNNIYTNLQPPVRRLGNNGFLPIDMLSDEGAGTFYGDAAIFNAGGYGPTNITNYLIVWSNCFRGVRKVNILLEKLPVVPTNTPDEEAIKKRLRGEGLFLRAALYADILKFFGRFPIMDKRLELSNDFQAPRNSYAECVAFIVKDLDEAIGILPQAYPANQLGRANKAMCMAYKSRVLLYAASPLNAADDPAKWQAAATAAKAVIDLNQFSLYNVLADKSENYKAIVNVYANPELIWFRDLGNGKLWEQNFYPIGSAGWGDCTPTQNMVDEYQMANGKDISDPSSGYDPAKPYVGREPRFYGTIWYNGSVVRGVKVETYAGGKDAINGGNNNTRTGYYLRKFTDETINVTSGAGRQMMNVVFRLAEMYLNYAEASNEAVANPTADPLIYTYVNLIRARAGLPNLPAGLSKSQMRAAIRHERRVELSFEEHRFFDDRRWKLTFGGDIKGIVWNSTGTSYQIVTIQNRPFSEKMYYMPIPQNEIDITHIQQNPGWN